MDTDLDLEIDANTPDRIPKFSCPIKGCLSALVDELDELERCEKCEQRVCEAHSVLLSRSQGGYFICSDCDRKEKTRMEALLGPLGALIDGVRNHSLLSSDVEDKLAELALDVATIRGEQ